MKLTCPTANCERTFSDKPIIGEVENTVVKFRRGEDKDKIIRDHLSHHLSFTHGLDGIKSRLMAQEVCQ